MAEVSVTIQKIKDLIADGLADSTKIEEVYDNWVETYVKDIDKANYRGPRAGTEKLHQFVTDKHALILDGGCGVGEVGRQLKELGFGNLHGIDLSTKSIEFCKTLNIYQRLIIDKFGDNRLDVPDDTYDALITIGTFVAGHVNQSAFPEFCRIVKPGGYILIGMREEYLDTAPEYKNGQLEGEMKRFVNEGKWEWIQKESFPEYIAGKSGAHFVFRVSAIAM